VNETNKQAMKGYVLLFSQSLATREELQAFLDHQPENGYWYSPLRNCIFFTSTLSALELRKRIDANFGVANHFFLILEPSRNADGRLPWEAWNVLFLPDDVNDDEMLLT
jgi:hypothetical protein